MMTLAPAALAVVLVFAGLLGLIIGSFLNVVIYRVPAGIALTRDSRCTGCDQPVRPWQNIPVGSWLALRGKCASCAAPISGRYPLVELATGLAFAGIVSGFVGDSADASGSVNGSVGAQVVVIISYLYFAAISIALAMIDLDTRRLPNAIVLPSYIVAGVLFTLACVLGADWSALFRAAIGGAVLYVFYFILRLVRPDGMGGGDVKLAGVAGIYLAWLGWGTLVVGAFAAFVLGGVFGIALIIARRAKRTSAIPFGPWMLAGAWVGIFAGESLAQWYIGLFGSA